MGSIIGGVIGGIGSLFGGSKASSQALTGYNYLTGGNGPQPVVNNGVSASNMAGQLTGTSPIQPGTQNAFNNYLNSTGYQFQRNQGTQALTGSAAARGILNSGSTAKALTQYGQGLAGQSFNNYLNQLNTQTNEGLTATGQIGSAGTQGGGNAASQTSSGIGGATTAGVNLANGLFGSGSLSPYSGGTTFNGVGGSAGLNNFFANY